uniref:Carboxypeptidase n=1 Tax=Anopheles epiroticus TaxID=199890 RepID=A0A182P9E3_9DIPT
MLKYSVVLALVALSMVGAVPREGFGPGMQDWGFAEVRPGAHMFWWLYYTTADVPNHADRPLVIWLQGGPGASSMYGNFEELGPLTLELDERNHTWVRDYNVLFIDNPVGTGFSYVEDYSLLTKTNGEIADDLVELMKQFYTLQPEFRTTPLHIYAESYGGKMAPEFAYVLDKAIKNGEIECNLQSVGIVAPWVSPIDSVLSWAEFLLNMGYVDTKGYNAIQASAIETEHVLNQGLWEEATNLWGKTENVIVRETHGIDFYNVLFKQDFAGTRSQLEQFSRDMRSAIASRATRLASEDRDQILQDLMRFEVAPALSLPAESIYGAQSGRVFNTLAGDFMKPAIDVMELLLNNTSLDVVIITGQLDLIVATPGNVRWIEKIQWSGRNNYLQSPRNAVGQHGVLEGYEKSYGKLAVYWALRAGHMVPADNPILMDYILQKHVPVYSILKFLYILVTADGFGSGKQHWGYSEVRPRAYIFWWLYQAQTNRYEERPLIIWLQGGPGASSSGYGNFEEIGPLDRTLKPRDNSWVCDQISYYPLEYFSSVKDYNVLFVDSPVGSGFSYVEDHTFLARNSSTVVSDLVVFLKNFYHTISSITMYDWEGNVPLYIASESYGGRIAVEFAYSLTQAVNAGTMHCKLRGLFLGSAWLSPMDSIAAWPTYLASLGYLDESGRERIERKIDIVNETTVQRRSGLTMDGWQGLQQTIIQKTGGINCYNVLKPTRREIEQQLENASEEVLEYGETLWWYSDTGKPHGESHSSSPLEQLMRGPVSHTLGIAPQRPPWGTQRTAVFDALGDDFLQSSIGTVERLLNETNLELILYSGQLDLITCLPGTLAWINRLFHNPLGREPFTTELSGTIEGYRTTYSHRFTHYTVLRAGHMVPADNPSAMMHILHHHIHES